VDSWDITLPALTDLEYYENLKEVRLRWVEDFSVKQALAMLKRCTNLRRLTLERLKAKERLTFPTSEEFCDFVMELKDLTFLHILSCDIPPCNHFKSEVDEVKAFVLPRRPNFKFYISCCEQFNRSRVSSCM
jgi:hypothetical protein